MDRALTVLLVEDSAIDAELIAQVLRAAGFDLSASRVETREDFLRAIQDQAPDVILADYKLPQFDGRSALLLAREHVPHVPVIIVTGTMLDDAAVELLREGAADYILKDRLSRLPAAVRRALDEVNAAAQARASAEALIQSESKFRRLFESSRDGILILDAATGVIEDANPFLLELLGCPRSALLGKRLWEVDVLDNIAATREAFDALRSQHCARHENLLLRTMDGRAIDAELVSNVYAVENREVIQCNIRDISVRRAAERQLASTNRALRTLSRCNGALVHATCEADLLDEMCRIVVESGGYHMAWVGFAEHDPARSVRVAAKFGSEGGYLDCADICWADTERGRGPIGTAIRDGTWSLVANTVTDPCFAPWRTAAIRQGYGSVLALPLRSAATTFGALGIYAAQHDAFDTEEIALLGEMADDLAFGIVTLRLRLDQAHSGERLQRSMESTVQAIAATLELRDPYTAGHQNRVAELAVAIARELALPEEQIHGIHLASIVHDVGKIQIPAEILTKPTKLFAVEYEIIKTHVQSGYEILKDVDFPWPIAHIVLQHHERLDGTGYPRGLRGDDILIEARIIAVADTVEAMSAARPYRPTIGEEQALQEIARGRGTRFDARCVDACLRLFAEKRFAFSAAHAAARP